MKKKHIIVTAIISLVFTSLCIITCNAETIDGGEYRNGDSYIIWELDDEGVLLLSGSGEMANFPNSRSFVVPYYNYLEDIKEVVIGYGITSIGNESFYDCYRN